MCEAGTVNGAPGTRSGGVCWPEPVSRNVRWQEDRFEEGFTFTPIGLALRAQGTPVGERRPLSPG